MNLQETTQQELEAYTADENNLVRAIQGRKCVDGRYDTDQGMIARPGGDFGYVMILLALNKEFQLEFSPEICVEKVYAAITDNDNMFYLHTDSHTEIHTASIGCGHIANAMKADFATSLYHLDPEEVSQAKESIIKKAKTDKRISIVVLQGEHKEKAVIKNIGKQSSIKPHNMNQMYFIYDETRDILFMEHLLNVLKKTNPFMQEITIDDFVRISTKQLLATLHLLAIGKPIFEINCDMLDRKKITFIGNVL